MTNAAAAGVALAALLLVGCPAGKKKPPPQVRTIDGESAILPRVARQPSPAATRTSVRAIDVGGTTRRYVLVAPTPVAPGRTYPLVLVFHGDGGDAPGFHGAWPFERATGADAFLAYPEGIARGWDLETTRDNREVRFVEAIVRELATAESIDRGRVFAAGYSSGGFVANVVACHRPGLFRAIASNAGGAPYNQLEKWGNGYPKCPGQKPVAMLALHGERDFGVTLDSGRFSAEYWAYVNGCDTDAMETTGYPECRVYRGCPSDKAVGFCSIPPLGHWVWDASAEVSWTFFQKVSATSGGAPAVSGP